MSKLSQAFDLLEQIKTFTDYVTTDAILPCLRFNSPDVLRQQVVNLLVKRNILVSQPGPGGGIKPNLSRSVTAYDVVEAVEPIDNLPPIWSAQIIYIDALKKLKLWQPKGIE